MFKKKFVWEENVVECISLAGSGAGGISKFLAIFSHRSANQTLPLIGQKIQPEATLSVPL